VKRSKPRYLVSAGLIRSNGRVLITKRPTGSHLSGFWEFPGGKREDGENLEECLVREIREELGVSVRVERFLSRVDHEYGGFSISLHLFLCSEPQGEPVPLGCESLAWVHPEELIRYPMPPADEQLIRLVRDYAFG
jgi:8-oxo-dGTP diphosphatase